MNSCRGCTQMERVTGGNSGASEKQQSLASAVAALQRALWAELQQRPAARRPSEPAPEKHLQQRHGWWGRPQLDPRVQRESRGFRNDWLMFWKWERFLTMMELYQKSSWVLEKDIKQLMIVFCKKKQKKIKIEKFLLFLRSVLHEFTYKK